MSYRTMSTSTFLLAVFLTVILLVEGSPVISSGDKLKTKKEAHSPDWHQGHHEMRWSNQLSPVDIDIPYKREAGAAPPIDYQLSPVDIDIPYKKSENDQSLAIYDPFTAETKERPTKKRNLDTTIVDLNTLERIVQAGKR